MMTLSLPETETQIKTLRSDRLAEAHHDVEAEPAAGEIVIRIGLIGIASIQILAKSSAEEDALRERLTVAWPALEHIHNYHPSGVFA